MAMNVGQDPDSVNKVVTGTWASGVAFLQRRDVDAFFVFPDSKITLQKMGIELEYLPTDCRLATLSIRNWPRQPFPERAQATIREFKTCL